MERIKVGEVGVDTGRIIVCDPSYIISQRIGERHEEIMEAQLKTMLEANSQQEAVDLAAVDPLYYTLPYLMGHEGAAVVVHSGIGDGGYPVYAWIDDMENWGRRVVRLEVDFMDHPWLEVVPIEPPDALKRLLDNLAAWLPLVEGADAADYLRRVNQMLETYKPEEGT